MVKPAKVTNTKGKDVQAHYVEFETPTGTYTAYLDWGYGDQLILEVWEDETDNTLFDETITLD
tara:strand:- start:47 stop:235 length:189 start_codon:yes stop_codon:yes gene_type:complete